MRETCKISHSDTSFTKSEEEEEEGEDWDEDEKEPLLEEDEEEGFASIVVIEDDDFISFGSGLVISINVNIVCFSSFNSFPLYENLNIL